MDDCYLSIATARNCTRFHTVVATLLLSISVAFMTSAATATTVAGDVAPYGNPDDELNAGDLTVIQQFLLGIKSPTSQEINQCDVAPSGSPDGFLNVADYLLLQRAVLGLITLPPVGVAPNAPVLFAGESPTNESAYLISGAADPDSTINVYVNGTPQRTKLADSNGDFLSYAKLQAGSNTIYVTASYGTLEGDPSNILNVDFVSLPPTADPGGPYTGPVYEYLYFDGRGSADKYNRYLTYQWDFGDGGTATGATPSHRYVSTGTYTVTLTVTAGGQVSTPVTTSITIKGKEYLTYSANRTLSSDRIYIVDHNYTVPQLDTLTIEAGTELRFDYDGGLEIHGTLDVRGTAAEPVRFSPLKGLADGYYPWLGIWLADYRRNVVIDHAIIEGALDGISVSYNGSEATIRNSIIQDNRWTGINIYSSKADNIPTSPRVSGNLIQSTAIDPYGQSVGVFIKGDAKPLIIDGNIIRFNETGIGLGSGTALEGNPRPVITGNAIYRNVWNYSAYRPYPLQPLVLNAQDNWWGTTDTVLINRDITDRRDDSQYVSVDYSNFRTLPLDHDLVLDPVYAETADNPYFVKGTAQPGAEVNLYARGSETFLLGTAVADANGRFAHPVAFPEEGGYDLIARRVVNGVEVESSIPTLGFYYTPAPWWSDVPIINQVPIPITSNPYEITIDRDRDFREANIYVNGELQGMAMASYSSLYFLATLNAGANTLEAAFLTPTGEGPRSSPMTVYYVPDSTVADFTGGTIGQYQHVVLPPAVSPYQIDSDIVIETLGKLTLQAGAVMEFQPGIGIYASGELSVQGTAANPVHLQSAATTPLASDWIGILIPPNADMNTRIEHALIEHSALGIIFNSSFATVDHTTLQNNYYGIYADAGSNPVISNTSFRTTPSGLWVNGKPAP